MQTNTLRRDLLVLWSVIAAVSALLVWLLLEISRQGATTQIDQARFQLGTACHWVQQNAVSAGLNTARWDSASQVAALESVMDLTLRDTPGVEGGFWQPDRGVFAYAFPTYDGTGVKRDPPEAELEKIISTAQLSSRSQRLIMEVRPGLREAVVFAACPLVKEAHAPVAWMLKRVLLIHAEVLNHLSLGLVLLTGFVVVSGFWLGWLLVRWQRQTTVLMQQLAQSERMATLGRLSAGLAHEIRNPLATIRMKVENAIAAAPELREKRVESAFQAVLAQATRLESLVSSLLALTHPLQITRQAVDLQVWFEHIAETHQESADLLGVVLMLDVDSAVVASTRMQPWIDPDKMAQVMDNLVLNALAHASPQDEIRLGMRMTADNHLHFWVSDTGSGVPEHLRGHIFEPFSTARSGGTGLGLALARELVQAHGGRITLASTPAGAHFDIEIPWQNS